MHAPLLSASEPDYVRLIENADVGAAKVTPLEHAALLSKTTRRNVQLKLESAQPVFSFKLRGAFNMMRALDAKQKKRGVITVSAGNHAQGVALAAKLLDIHATIVMPMTTPEVKINSVYGINPKVQLLLHGDAFPEALQKALDLQREEGRAFVHPYDDARVIAGQGTIAREIFSQHAEPVEAIFVPVGGGGLIGGIAAWTKFHHPNVKIVGVEPTDSNCLYQALAAGHCVTLPRVGLFADGVAVAEVGEEPFRLAQKYVDEVICVDDDEICAAAMEIFADKRVMPEPAGALGVAGLKRYAARGAHDNGALVAIVSGANVDPERMRYMAERGALAQKREILLAVALPEKPGTLKKLCTHLGKRSITEFNYRYAGEKESHILIGVRVQDYARESAALTQQLAGAGFVAQDVTNNELAREHLRHMVGGQPNRPIDEMLYSFEFAERPGELLAFLDAMPPSWNITLFHYRCHGASRGRVLIGIDAPGEHEKLREFAENGGYNGKNESANPVYAAFLRHATP